jgi:hypothetical protein
LKTNAINTVLIYFYSIAKPASVGKHDVAD